MEEIHKKVVNEQCKKYNKEWLVFTELTYQNYRFDIFAFNPKTKQIEITEVDISTIINQKKIDFAKTLGNVNIIHSTKVTSEIIPKKFQDFLKAISNKIRIAILDLLVTHGSMKYSSIMYELGMFPAKDAGRFAYHLRILLKTKLVTIENCQYTISEKGKKILQICLEL